MASRDPIAATYEARHLDPAGEQDLPVRKARAEAAKALGLPPAQNPW